MIITDLTAAPKYSVIYADPPWKYNDKRGNTAKWGAIPYSTMNTTDICLLPIKDIASDDCVLFLWATYPTMPDAFKVIEKWGFKYKTVAFTWVKLNPKNDGIYSGMGHWTNANAEICLLATKGHPKRVCKSVKQIIITHRGRHSEKPVEARERIVQLMGDIPRIELFARQTADGWDSWGDEVEAFK